jgi:hypothetical protein
MAFPKIAPLDLPGAVPATPINFSPLSEIGNTIAEGRRKQQIADVLSRATDARGNLDVERAGTLLAQIGEDPKAFLALAQQKAALAQHAGQAGASLAEQTRHNQAVEALTRQQFEEGKLPPGTMSDPNTPGGIAPRPGYIDYLSQSTNAKIPTDALLTETELVPLAKQLNAGDTSVLTNLSRGGLASQQNVVALRKMATKLNAEAGVSGEAQAAKNAEFFGEKAGQRTLGTRSANIELPAAEFQQMAPLALQASEAVDRSQFPNLNAVTNAIQKGTGGEAIVRFNTANNTLVNVYARAVSPTGVPTDEVRKKAFDILNTGFSKGQYGAAVDMMWQEIAAARASPGSVRQQMRENFIGGQQPGGAGALKQFRSPEDVGVAVQRGLLKSGDTFLDSNGTRRMVP